MLMSEEMKYVHGGNPLARRSDHEVPDRNADDSLEGSIPPRYRDGLGGINLEQVKRDQRRARQAFVRAMLRSLGKRWHRR